MPLRCPWIACAIVPNHKSPKSYWIRTSDGSVWRIYSKSTWIHPLAIQRPETNPGAAMR